MAFFLQSSKYDQFKLTNIQYKNNFKIYNINYSITKECFRVFVTEHSDVCFPMLQKHLLIFSG
jgi:hypothetical protein